MIHTQLAGASGGALVAASTAVGISPEEQIVAYKDMSRVCRANGGFWGKVGGVVRQSLDEHFPKNAHEICNERYGLSVHEKKCQAIVRTHRYLIIYSLYSLY